MKTTYKIVLILVGGFVAYTLAIWLYAQSFPAGGRRNMVMARYAPWLPLLGVTG